MPLLLDDVDDDDLLSLLLLLLLLQLLLLPLALLNASSIGMEQTDSELWSYHHDKNH